MDGTVLPVQWNVRPKVLLFLKVHFNDNFIMPKSFSIGGRIRSKRNRSFGNELTPEDWHTSDDAALNTAFVDASADLEETLVSPILVPAVGNSPIRCSALNTPTNNFDGVAFVNRRTIPPRADPLT